jgi:hypothetical protein
MQAYWIGYSVLFGIWLAIADGIAIDVKMKHGQRPGLAMWFIAVLVPLAQVFYLSPKVGLTAVVFGTAMSLALKWLKQQVEKEHRGEPTSPLLHLF